MTTTPNSATIHQFPARDRVAAARASRPDAFDTRAQRGVSGICADALDGAWYHGDAVRADEQVRTTVVPLPFPRQ